VSVPHGKLFAEVPEKSGRLPEERQDEEEQSYGVVGDEETAGEEADKYDQQRREEITDVEAIREHQTLLRNVQCQFYE